MFLYTDSTRRNLLICRSYLEARKITAADVEIDKDLVDMGNQAHSEYQKALDQQKKKKTDEEIKRKQKEEEERMKSLAKRDKERRSELMRIKDKEIEALKLRQAAEVGHVTLVLILLCYHLFTYISICKLFIFEGKGA